MALGQPMKSPLEKESDWDLIKRFQDDDQAEAAFEVLYYRHFDYVRRLVIKFLWDSSRADDVEEAVQVVFIVASRKLRDFKFQAKLTTWLYSATRYVVYNLNKKRAKERGLFHPLPDTVEELHGLLEELELSVPQPVDPAHEAEFIDVMREAIDSLSEIQKEVIVLRLGGHSPEEMERILGVERDRIKSRLHEARQSLKRRLGYYREARQSVNKRLGHYAAPRSHLNAARQQTETPEITAFKGKNVLLEQYVQMSREEKLRLQENVERENTEWLQRKFSTLPEASWLMVVDGKVIAHGRPKDYPSDAQLLELIQDKAKGRYPFYFDNPLERVIEESGWHPTNIDEDFYPALLFRVGPPQSKQTVEVEADFDTGGRSIFFDFKWLQRMGVAEPSSGDPIKGAKNNLGSYIYSPKRLQVELVSESGITKSTEIETTCVFDWKDSPFVVINPDRVALVGRGLALELRPMIQLDFDKRLSRVYF
jgi:RNA polymerase sigma-70 factor (ECF subfamily)